MDPTAHLQSLTTHIDCLPQLFCLNKLQFIWSLYNHSGMLFSRVYFLQQASSEKRVGLIAIYLPILKMSFGLLSDTDEKC